MTKYNFVGVSKAYAKDTKNGWLTCYRINFSALVCSN